MDVADANGVAERLQRRRSAIFAEVQNMFAARLPSDSTAVRRGPKNAPL